MSSESPSPPSSPTEKKVKLCNKCKVKKELSDFSVQSENPNSKRKYYKSFCKKCCSKCSKYQKKASEEKLKRGRQSFLDKNPEKREVINEMLESGCSKKEIAEELGLNLFTFYRILRTL